VLDKPQTHIDLDAAARAHLADRNRKFAHDRSQTIGASEIGQCARRIWAEKKLGEKGYDKGFLQSRGAAMRGDILEDNWTVPVVKRAVENAGGRLLWAGQGEQRTFEALPWKISATPDGLATGLPDDFLSPYGVTSLLGKGCVAVEMKSFDPRKNVSEFPIHYHVPQVITQMGLIRQATDHEPDWGLIVYVNASFVDDILAFPIHFQRESFNALIRRALWIMGAKTMDDLPPEGKSAGGKECEHCPFAKQCHGWANAVPPKEKPIMDRATAEMLRSAVGTYSNTSTQIAGLEQRREQAKDIIRTLLNRQETRFHEGKLKDGRDFKITWSKKRAPENIDLSSVLDVLAEYGHDPDDFRKAGKPSDSLTITLTKQDAGKPKKEKPPRKTKAKT
jgi:CRISPR/Cas system-associated exonuclease Cas4 (RecB family)